VGRLGFTKNVNYKLLLSFFAIPAHLLLLFDLTKDSQIDINKVRGRPHTVVMTVYCPCVVPQSRKLKKLDAMNSQISSLPQRSTLLQRLLLALALILSLFLLTGCEQKTMIIDQIDQREANEIVVFLASKGIAAEKTATASTAPGGTEGGTKYGIFVEMDKATDAMAILNQNGFPRKQGTTLLELFAGGGLMTSDKQENIRYQAGLAQQIANMIRKIDGVIEAEVQLSFPAESTSPIGPGGGAAAPVSRITAAVYVKHMGILDDPNSHLVTKIKRLVAGSVSGLEINDVTVISDRSRFTDVTLMPSTEALEPKAKEYVSIWSIVMSKSSASRFRFIFFCLIAFALAFACILGWLLWKFYPLLKKQGGLKSLLRPAPLSEQEGGQQPQTPPEETK
jgi:type III secretion protein J